MNPPFFSPSSVFWRVNREMACALAGPRAILMQIAHPLIAEGVAEHSSFRRHRLSRLFRTSLAAAAVTFGTRQFALRTIGSINRKHGRVHGFLRSRTGPFAAGTPYDANDPDLKLWVLATIMDSTLEVHDLFVSPLTASERAAYYRDLVLMAKLFGVPAGRIPPTSDDFHEYVRSMVAGDAITVGDTAREIAGAIFSPSIIGGALYAGSVVGIGLLPERMRREFGFRWSPRAESRLRSVAAFSRAARRHLPTILCASPAATVSEHLFSGERRGRRSASRAAHSAR